MSSGYVLTIDGVPYAFATAGISSIASWDLGEPAGVTVVDGALEQPTGSYERRLRPLEGTCDVTPLSFVVYGVAHKINTLFARLLEDVESVTATATITDTAATIVVDDATPFAPALLPRYIWINGEALRVWASAGTTLSVDRARYGSRAQRHEYNAARAIAPIVYLECPWIVRRRCVLWRVMDGVARAIYQGHCAQAPRLNTDGTSWTISTTHALVREGAVRVIDSVETARTVGYDRDAIRIDVLQGDTDALIASSGAAVRRVIYASLIEALNDHCDTLRAALVARGASNVSVVASARGGEITVMVTCQLWTQFTLRVRVGDQQADSASVDVSTARRVTVTLAVADDGALAVLGWQPYGLTSNPERLSVLAPSPELDVSSSAWAPITITGDYETTIAPILVDSDLVLDPRVETPPVWALETTRLRPPHWRLRAVVYDRDRDAAVWSPPRNARSRPRAVGSRTFQRALAVECDHWLWALRAVYQHAVRSDSRCWDWSTVARTAQQLGGGLAAQVRWLVTSERQLGEWIVDEAALRGACLGVRGSKLTVIAVTPPLAHEEPVLTITDGDLEADARAQIEQWEDGVLTAVTIASPERDTTVVDAIAVARHGDARTITLRAEGLRHSDLAATDPLQWGRELAQRPLRLWSDPVLLARIPLPSERRAAVDLGDLIELNLVACYGVSRRGRVIGISEDLATGSTVIEALLLAQRYAYAPCARVESISGDWVEVVAAGPEHGDYAGSSLAGYEHVAGDGGVSWWQVGDLVELVQRDSATPVAPELRKIAAIDPTVPRVQLDAAPAAVWSTLPMVDLRTAAWADSTSNQRARWAYASDGVTIAAGVRTRRWAP